MWFGQVKRREQECVGRQTLEMAIYDGTYNLREEEEAEMDGQCQPRPESCRDNRRLMPELVGG